MPEIALQSLFSMAWLDSVNREREQRGASRLKHCLLSAHGDVFRVPWEDLVYPQFISRRRTSLQEDKELSVKDGDMFIDRTHNPCRDSNTSGQNAKLLPSSSKTDQSPLSSEDSEGEYVELTELPLPRFSPQKGSLTQSISLQHRARTGTHTTTHTPHNTTALTHTATHTPHNTTALTHTATHTPHNTTALTHTATHTATHTPHNTTAITHTATHTPHNITAITHTGTHTPHNTTAVTHKTTHTPHNTTAVTHKTTHTHTVGNTHSSWSCVEVSSHTGRCSSLIQENLSQDPCRPVILIPTLPTSTFSAPPEVVGTSSCQIERLTSQEQIEGTDSGKSVKLHTDQANYTDQREEEEVGRGEQGEKEAEREEGDVMERQMELRRDDILLLHTHTDEDRGERGEHEEEDEEGELDGGDGELEADGAEEVEVEEEVQVIVVQQRQERRQEEQVKTEGGREGREGGEREGREGGEGEGKGGEREGREGGEGEGREGGEREGKGGEREGGEGEGKGGEGEGEQRDEKADLCLNTHPEDSYSESKTLQKHAEDSYFEGNRQDRPLHDSYSENHTLEKHFDESEWSSEHTHTKESNTPAMNPDSLWTEQSENGPQKQEEKKEEEEEQEESSCEEVGGGRTAELQTEGTETFFSSAISFPLLPLIPQTIRLLLSLCVSSSSSSDWLN